LQLGLFGLLGACDDEEEALDASFGGFIGGFLGGGYDAGTPGGTMGGSPGGSDAGSPGGSVGGNDAGATGNMDAGSSGGTDGSTGITDGAAGNTDGAAGNTDGAAGNTDGAVSNTDAGSTDAGSGPLPLPSPSMVGPYEAIEEENVGKGFENPINPNDADDTACLSFIESFGQDATTNTEYAKIPPGHDMALYTLYRPKELRAGVKYPALSWANGTCAHPVGYAEMIKHIVSHGFLVVAAHSRYTGSGEAQIRGLNWLLAQNENSSSPLFGHVDTGTIGVFGHSQGGMSTSIAAADPRVDSVILMHGSAGGELHSPTLYLSSDIEALLQYPSYLLASVPAAYGKLNNSDHITMMTEHERMAPEVTAWFRYTLLNDQEARKWFAGADCILCNDAEWDYEAKNLK
jgi:hypothetical protein